ncbi:MAG: hypothetical protein ACYDH9_06995 [Limisphaerales bacterium]
MIRPHSGPGLAADWDHGPRPWLFSYHPLRRSAALDNSQDIPLQDGDRIEVPAVNYE